MESLGSFYKHKVSLSNWQLSVLKWSSGCMGIAIGVYFTDVLRPYILLFVGIGLALGIWLTPIWFKAMKESS